ncbi:MAG: glycosyltransferase [Lachnospiraceae bacterium]|nr:glycosyltransferase [Lachnospiraceae bacterium]
MKTKVLFCGWDTHIEKRIEDALRNLGSFETERYLCQFRDYKMDAVLAQELLFKIHEQKSDCLFSVNFVPMLAEIAKTAGILYISWLQDSPNLTLYYPCVAYETNRIFSFDSAECMKVRNKTGANIYYLPLASSPKYFEKCIAASAMEVENKVCFLGTSYKGKYYDRAEASLSPYEKGYYEGLMAAGSNLFGCSIIEEVLLPEKAKALLERCQVPRPEDYLMTEVELATYILEQKMSSDNRLQMLPKIAEKYPVVIYSGSDDWKHPGIIYKGYADYETQMPVIYHKSAINLNFTLRSIRTGMPLRVMDILACEGFLLTNYQQDLVDAFVPEEELSVFESWDELLDKVDYYMERPEVRREIAKKGKEKIEKYFTYEMQLAKLFEMAFA